jgi:uncharacterized membrane protein
MSLESGRKLGLTASLINIIIPVAIIALYGLLIFSIMTSVISAVAHSGSHTLGYPLISSTIFLIVLIGLTALSVAGIVMFLMGMHRLGQFYHEPSIYKNSLYGFLIGFLGVIALLAVSSAYTFFIISRASSSAHVAPSLGTFVLVFLSILAAGFVIGILSAVFYMKAFNKLGDISGIHSFNTAAMMYLVGAVLSIILIGSFVVWIAWIFAASGFNSLRPKPTETGATAYPTQTVMPPQTISSTQLTPPPSDSISQKNLCPYCGAVNLVDSKYCWSCGKPLA